jgi:uncharacterized protein
VREVGTGTRTRSNALKPHLTAALFLLLAACTRGTSPPQPARPLAPKADHHLHLLSPAAALSKLREAPVPAELARVLRLREAHWNDAAGLSPLFSEDAALLVGNSRWLEGRQAVTAYLARSFTGPYLFKPVSHRIDGAVAQLSGYMLEGDGSEVHFAFFHQLLHRGPDGTWRIRTETQVFPGPVVDPPLTAAQLVAQLDAVGIPRGVVVSNAYYFALSPQPAPQELEKVRAENDWTAQQVEQFPTRLVAFCSVNPLRDYALQELERCAASRRFRGLKLHLNGAQVDYQDPAQVEKVRRVMAAANGYRLPMVIHVRSSNEYGREDAEVFLHQLVAAAPDVTVQIAHLWGGESFAPDALAVYADAVAAGDPVTRRLYFDISGAWSYGKKEQLQEIVQRMRQIGLSRILYASDAPPPEAWKALQQTLPLTPEELRTLAGNVAPYLSEP